MVFIERRVFEERICNNGELSRGVGAFSFFLHGGQSSGCIKFKPNDTELLICLS
jgi:hypothetical protein